MTRQFRIVGLAVALILAVSTVHAAAQNGSPQQPKNSIARPAQMESDQMTNIPYFTLRDGMSSTLTLNNLAPSPTPVTVTIYNMEGKAQVLDPITLSPHSVKQVELRDVVVSDEFNSGNIEVAFKGIPMVVTCQVSVSNPDKRVSFESREQDMMDFNSQKLNGILWLAQREAEGFLAITNTAKNKVTVDLAVGSKQKTVTLYPRETRLLKLSEEFGQRPPVSALVKLQHSGLPGDIITTGYVLNLEDGYSSSFAMVDPAIMRSTHLAGAHLRIGKPDPSEGFPEDTQFRSPLLMANVGTNPVTARVSVDYTVKEKLEMTRWDRKDSTEQKEKEEDATQDKFSTVAVKTLTIAPGDIERLELSEELAKLGVKGPVEEAGVDIDYEASPGALIGHLVSVDQSGDYSFEVPIKDPAAMNEMMEGGYPWTLEKGTNTVLHLKNTTDKSVVGLVVFTFPGGTYNPDRIQLEPYQTVAIDIQKLKDSKKRDVRKQLFPADAVHGQVIWRQETPYSLIGRAEEVDSKAGIARSFSCGFDCCVNYSDYFYLTPNTFTGPVGGTQALTANEAGNDCSGYPFGPYIDTPSSWSSNNTSVATVSSGQVSLVGGGSTNIVADFTYGKDYYYDSFQICRLENNYWAVASQATACVPASVRIIVDITAPRNNQDIWNFCNNSEYLAGSYTGIERCFLFQLVDSCGNDITTRSYRGDENRTLSVINGVNQWSPPNQTITNISGNLSPNGTFTDMMWYVGASPGDYLKVNQVISVVDLSTGVSYQVATFCQDYEYRTTLHIDHYAGICQ